MLGLPNLFLTPRFFDKDEKDECIPNYWKKNYEDYWEVPYQSLVSLKRLWNWRIIESLDMERQAGSTRAMQDGGESTAERRDRSEGPEMKLSSYNGKTDQEKIENRRWFWKEYEGICKSKAPWPSEQVSHDNWAVPETLRSEHKYNGGMYSVFFHEF